MLKRGVRIEPLWNGVEVSGRPLPHGKVLAFEPDTTTPKPLWKTSDQSVPWNGPDGNQVDLDEHGKALAYGHGFYELVVCSPSLAPLERWEPLFFGHSVVSARDFGARGAGDDSIEDDTAALQAAVDHCIRTGAKLFVPAGTYKLTDSLRLFRLAVSPDAPLSVGRGSVPDDRRVFAPFRLEVMGERAAFGIRGNDTVLLATFTDRPAIVVQGASGVSLHRLVIEGQSDYGLSGDYHELLDDKTFSAARCRDGDNRLPASPDNAVNSPYAAIAIDPFRSGGPPADGGYPGHLAEYGRNALSSVGVTIEQCSFHRFVVGVIVAPSGAASHPENIAICDSTFEHHKVSVAVCHGKSFDVALRNVRSFGNLFFVSTCSYGDGAPSAEIPSIRGATVGATKYLFNVNAPDPSAMVEGLACESTLSLGFIHSGYATEQPAVTFVGCTFDLAETAPAVDTHLSSTASVRFVGCSFATASHALPIRFFNGGPMAFASCTFLNIAAEGGAGDPSSQIGFVGFEAMSKVTFEECSVGDRSVPNQLMVLDRVHRTSRLSSLHRTYVLPGSLIVAADTSGGELHVSQQVKEIRVPDVLLRRDHGAPGEATFTAPDPSILRPGDLVFALDPGWVPEHYGIQRRSHGVCGVVKSISGSTVRLASVVKSLGYGRHDLAVKYLPRLHLQSTGLTVAGSEVIAEVTNAETWRRYDRISGAGIPDGAFVVDVPPGAATLRISKAATASGRARLYDADITRFASPRGAYLKIDPSTGAAQREPPPSPPPPSGSETA